MIIPSISGNIVEPDGVLVTGLIEGGYPAEKAGITVIETYWTLGQYDVILIADAPDDESMAALVLSIRSLGNVRTQILRAYSADGISRILGKMV